MEGGRFFSCFNLKLGWENGGGQHRSQDASHRSPNTTRYREGGSLSQQHEDRLELKAQSRMNMREGVDSFSSVQSYSFSLYRLGGTQFYLAVPVRRSSSMAAPSADTLSALWEHQGDTTCENKRSPHQGCTQFEKTETKHTGENPIPRACGSLLRLLLPVAYLLHLRFFLAAPINVPRCRTRPRREGCEAGKWGDWATRIQLFLFCFCSLWRGL